MAHAETDARDKDATPSETPEPNPVMEQIGRYDTASAVALVGHPIHAMTVHFPIALVVATLGVDILYWITADPFWPRVALWSSGFAFGGGVVAAVAGTAELLLVKGIRVRVASWTHAVAAMMLLSITAANWGLRIDDPTVALPNGIALSALATIFAGIAGWHGGKLIFDHGVGVIVSAQD